MTRFRSYTQQTSIESNRIESSLNTHWTQHIQWGVSKTSSDPHFTSDFWQGLSALAKHFKARPNLFSSQETHVLFSVITKTVRSQEPEFACFLTWTEEARFLLYCISRHGASNMVIGDTGHESKSLRKFRLWSNVLYIWTFCTFCARLTMPSRFFFFHWRYSPGRAKASFKRFRHSSRLIAVFFQFLKPALAASSSIPSSQRNLGLPLGRCPPGPVNNTFLAESLSFNRMTCPAQLSLLNFINFFYAFI
jgi:hypothetical protein